MSIQQRPANMKDTYLYMLVLICLTSCNGCKIYSKESSIEEKEDDLKPLKRVTRHDIPQLPEMPRPPEIKPIKDMMLQMTDDHVTNTEDLVKARKRREAKGVGGSLPTRKG